MFSCVGSGDLCNSFVYELLEVVLGYNTGKGFLQCRGRTENFHVDWVYEEVMKGVRKLNWPVARLSVGRFWNVAGLCDWTRTSLENNAGQALASSGKVVLLTASTSGRKSVQQSVAGSLLGHSRDVETLWREFFADPSRWWDNRAEKANSRYPDFKHKFTARALWLDSKFKPLWVDAELVAMAPGTVKENIFTWNKRLSRYAKAGQNEKTLELFQQMQQEGIKPDKFTFVPVLNACSHLRVLEQGRHIHSQIIESGHESDIYVGSGLVNMYANCGCIEHAQKAFNKLPARDVVVWNAMIQGLVKCGQGQKALDLFRQMKVEGVDPDSTTCLGVVNACATVGALEEGRCVHVYIVQRGWQSDVFLGSSLVDMYAKCGSIEEAWITFNKMLNRNVVSWNAMILGLVKCGQGQKALNLSQQMRREGVEPNPVTFVGLLNACASIGALEAGRLVHKEIIQKGLESDIFVGNSLIDMYAKCGSIEDAGMTFSKMTTRDVVSWNAMILGHVKWGQGQKALDLFGRMQGEGVYPDRVSFVAVLNACASVAALEEGQRVHAQIKQGGWELDVFVANSLIDMYSKCGSLEDAQRVFDRMPIRGVVSWNAMLVGYAMHGYAQEALAHFERMCQEGLEMNLVTLLCLLSACSHGGLVSEGLHYFESISSAHSLSPEVGHYTCVIDLLGRVGRLHEAEDLIKTMPSEINATVWMSLLSACKVHGNLEMGESVAKQVLELDPEDAAGYVLLSNIYAAAGQWDSSAKVQQDRLQRRVKKTPGRTWIEVNNEVHSFTVDDGQHPQILDIHAELNRLADEMKEAGYVPDNRFLSHNVNKVEKGVEFCHHSEKLAIAYGLISTPPGTTLRVFKNLRVCSDCHIATKFISKIVGRRIIVRDTNRFHHFEDGFCSCDDFW